MDKKIEQILSIIHLNQVKMDSCKTDHNKKIINIELNGINNIYSDTPYYYSEKKILHFTTFNSLIKILKTNSLFLNTLNICNDDNELAHSSQMFQNIKGYYSIDAFNNYKNSELYSCCFAKFNKKNLMDVKFWDHYSNNKSSVCIEIDIKNSLEYWINFHISIVKYGKETLLEEFFTNIKEFSNKENYRINVFIPQILPFF